jgi:hypothetical protein
MASGKGSKLISIRDLAILAGTYPERLYALELRYPLEFPKPIIVAGRKLWVANDVKKVREILSNLRPYGQNRAAKKAVARG